MPCSLKLHPRARKHLLKFGAKDVFDLSWRNLLDAYSCTECGRCTAACPANQTGKLLSPRKIMMDTRDRLEEVGRNINEHGSFKDDSKTLAGKLYFCRRTTCLYHLQCLRGGMPRQH